MRPIPLLMIVLVLAASPAQGGALYSLSYVDCAGTSWPHYEGTEPTAWSSIDMPCALEGLGLDLAGSAKPGQLSAMAHAHDDIQLPFPESHVEGVEGGIELSMSFDDVHIQGPGSEVAAALRLDLAGFLDAHEYDGASVGHLSLVVELHETTFEGIVEMWHAEVEGRFGPYEEGILVGCIASTDGYLATLSGPVVTPVATLPVGTAFGLTVRLTAHARAQDPHMPAMGLADVSDGVSFPTLGPVFDLPAGFTIDCASAGIIDNSWQPQVATEPTSWGELKARF